MAEYILAVQFIGPVPSGTTVTMSWSGAGGSITSATEEFVPLRDTFFKTTIGSTPIQQAINFEEALLLDYNANLNVSRLLNTVYVSSKNTENPMSGSSTNANIVFNQPLDFDAIGVQEIRARSPYLLISESTSAFTESNFVIKAFEGSLLYYQNQPISYEKTKQKITPTQNNIWINLSNLLREDLNGNIDDFNDLVYTDSVVLKEEQTKWSVIDTTNYYLNTATTTTEKFFYVVDGYIEPNELHDLPNILYTGDKRYLYNDSVFQIYFKASNLTNIEYYVTPSTTYPVTFVGDLDKNKNYIQRITVDTSILGPNDNQITYMFEYDFGKIFKTFYFYPECKYRTYDLVFKNKYGMLETISMSKKTSKTLNVDSSEYLRSIVNLNGYLNINKHTSKQFNVSGTEEWTLNTDFLPEYMNAPIKEAMLSEEMWLYDTVDKTIIPVIRMDQSIDFKTSLNDKMIQYTIKVKLSHNTVNNIQ